MNKMTVSVSGDFRIMELFNPIAMGESHVELGDMTNRKRKSSVENAGSCRKPGSTSSFLCTRYSWMVE